MIKWIQSHRAAIWWIAGASILVFIASLIIVPLLVVRIPSDYFAHRSRHIKPRAGRRSLLRWVLLVGKNLLGYVFVFAGLIMLVLPGQGMVTILIGITLVDFPGKYRFERWVVSRGPVLRSINRLRKRAGRPPLFLEE
ncbi:MAG: PGPGW domain-containing protein [bacterium]|nr:PGPGW domain-containing protein [bacterium]